MDSSRSRGWLVVGRISGFHHGLEHQLIWTSFICLCAVRFQGRDQALNALQEPIIYDSLILVRFDFMLAFESLLVNLVLLGSYERSLVDIRVDLNI